MPTTLQRTRIPDTPNPAPAPRSPAIEVDERLARRDLRRQIGRLERRLGELFGSAFPRHGIDWGIGAVGGPRILSTGELERIRDSLSLRLRDAQAELAQRADAEEAKRGLLERMIVAPEDHRWVIVSNEDIGERGCRHWHSRPRWGILGMLFGWWRIRLSSGCPLAEGLRPPASAARHSSRSTPVARKRRKPRPRRPAATPAPAATQAKRAAVKPRREIADERPPAPWGSFPLVELAVLVGLVLFVVGFFFVEGARGTELFATGLAIASLAGLELSVREHFAGYRSHSTLLAAVAGVASMLAAYYLADLSPVVAGIAGAVAFGVALWALVRAFRDRSGQAVKLR